MQKKKLHKLYLVFLLLNLSCTKKLILTEKVEEFSNKYTLLGGKININFKDDNIKKFKFVSRILKNEKIWISIKASFGIEIFRIVLTKKKIVFLNKIEKYCKTLNYNEISDFLGQNFNFNLFQEIILREKKFLEDSVKFNNTIFEISKYKDFITSILTILNQDSIPNKIFIQNISFNDKSQSLFIYEYYESNEKSELRYKFLDLHIKEKNSTKKININSIRLNILKYNNRIKILTFPFEIPLDYEIL